MAPGTRLMQGSSDPAARSRGQRWGRTASVTPPISPRLHLHTGRSRSYKALKPIPKDERLLGFHAQYDQYGEFITYALMADCQDETPRKELIEHGPEPRMRNISPKQSATSIEGGTAMTRPNRGTAEWFKREKLDLLGRH
jgi:hypothetical protein